jgi:hypothetical protein
MSAPVADVAAAAAATATAAACAAATARRAVAERGPRRPAFVAWTAAFLVYVVAAAALLAGAALGWDAATFRVYYLAGGILVVAYLAVGQLLVLAPGARPPRLAAASLLFLTFAAAAATLVAEVDEAQLARAGAAPPNDALDGFWAAFMAIALNSAGTVVLLVGSVVSARRRRDPGPLLVAAGVAVIALTASATRFDVYSVFALGQAAGLLLILAGLVARRRA